MDKSADASPEPRPLTTDDSYYSDQLSTANATPPPSPAPPSASSYYSDEPSTPNRPSILAAGEDVYYSDQGEPQKPFPSRPSGTLTNESDSVASEPGADERDQAGETDRNQLESEKTVAASDPERPSADETAQEPEMDRNQSESAAPDQAQLSAVEKAQALETDQNRSENAASEPSDDEKAQPGETDQNQSRSEKTVTASDLAQPSAGNGLESVRKRENGRRQRSRTAQW
jgi:hypothetical protein